MDSETGFDRAPDRYSRQGRETIDRIRDSMTDTEFGAFCRGNAMKYMDRAGMKGVAEADKDKAKWYMRMAMHIKQPSFADPRADRPDFQPYVRQQSPVIEAEKIVGPGR